MIDDSQSSSSESDLRESRVLEAGTVIFEKFEVIRRVGSGGMGVVYEARNLLLNKVVALKVLSGEYLSSTDVVRFQNEAKTLSKLDHTNIANVYDFGVGEGGRPYLSMEFIDGITLDTAIEKDGPLDIDAFLEIFSQVCAGLSHAHSKNVIHRDLKTGNIILSTDSNGELRAVLVDFGVARVDGEDVTGRLTTTGVIIGSPYYMSPEQVKGLPVSFRSDIYSLSCVMYHALVGRPPFQSNTILGTLTMHIEREPDAAALSASGEVPEEVCALILKGLSKQPDSRPVTVDEMNATLIQIASPKQESNEDESQSAAHAAQKQNGSKIDFAVPPSRAQHLIAWLLSFGIAAGAATAIWFFITSPNPITPVIGRKVQLGGSIDAGNVGITDADFQRGNAIFDNVLAAKEEAPKIAAVEQAIQTKLRTAEYDMYSKNPNFEKLRVVQHNFKDCLQSIDLKKERFGLEDERLSVVLREYWVACVLLRDTRESEPVSKRLLDSLKTRELAEENATQLELMAGHLNKPKTRVQGLECLKLAHKICTKEFGANSEKSIRLDSIIGEWKLQDGNDPQGAILSLKTASKYYKSKKGRDADYLLNAIRLGHAYRHYRVEDWAAAIKCYREAETVARKPAVMKQHRGAIGDLYSGWIEAEYKRKNAEEAQRVLERGKAFLTQRQIVSLQAEIDCVRALR